MSYILHFRNFFDITAIVVSVTCHSVHCGKVVTTKTVTQGTGGNAWQVWVDKEDCHMPHCAFEVNVITIIIIKFKAGLTI